MQLATADARQVAEDPRAPAIGAHRLLSNGRAAALVRADTEVDWWCAPRFDDPPLLWSLLDPSGARARWRIVRPVSADESPAGPATDTVVRASAGRVECRDGMVCLGSGATALVRLVRALDHATPMTQELSIGGFDGARAVWSGRSTRAGNHTVTVVGGDELHVHDESLLVQVTAERAWRGFAVVVGDLGPIGIDELVARLDDAVRDHDAWLQRAALTRQHTERGRDALRVLRSCTFAPTGAVIGAPTTSLPEVAGGDRQWDYRYSWLRDAGLAVSVASLLGERETAKRYLEFACSLAEDGAPTRPVVTVDGEPVPAEREIDDVAGWAGSRPVRLGNSATDQTQHDSFGLLLEAVSVHLQTGGRLDDHAWHLVRTVADHVASCASDRSNGIWEVRERREFVSGDIGRWLALDRALWIARVWRPWSRRGHWRRARDEVRDRVLDALSPDGRLPQVYDETPRRADASALMIPLFGLLSRRDRRSHAIVDAIVHDLGAGSYVYRYEPDGADGFVPGESAFVPMCWWAVSALARLGRVDEARARLDDLCRRLPRLLSEEIDPVTDESLGNVPLVWSHAELARALYLVDAAELRRRFSPVALLAWRLARYARLRWIAR